MASTVSVVYVDSNGVNKQVTYNHTDSKKSIADYAINLLRVTELGPELARDPNVRLIARKRSGSHLAPKTKTLDIYTKDDFFYLDDLIPTSENYSVEIFGYVVDLRTNKTAKGTSIPIQKHRWFGELWTTAGHPSTLQTFKGKWFTSISPEWKGKWWTQSQIVF